MGDIHPNPTIHQININNKCYKVVLGESQGVTKKFPILVNSMYLLFIVECQVMVGWWEDPDDEDMNDEEEEKEGMYLWVGQTKSSSSCCSIGGNGYFV